MGRGLRCVAHDGVVGQDQALDFIHTIGTLLVDRDIPGNQIRLVAVCCDAQGVDQTLTRLCVIHRAIRDAAANAVPGKQLSCCRYDQRAAVSKTRWL